MPSPRRKTPPEKGNSDDDDTLEVFHPSLWKMPSVVTASIPQISINETEVHLDDLDDGTKKQTQFTIDISKQSQFTMDSTKQSQFTFGFDSARPQFTFEPRMPSISLSTTNMSVSAISASDTYIHERIKRDQNNTNDEANAVSYDLRIWRRKVMVLIWANFVMRYRKQFVTLVELLFPAVSLAFLLTGMVESNTCACEWAKQKENEILDGAFDPTNIMSKESLFFYTCSNDAICDAVTDKKFYIVYSPNITIISSIMEEVRDTLMLGPDTKISKLFGVANAEEVERLCKEHYKSGKEISMQFAYGVVFSFTSYPDKEQERIRAGELPNQLTYSIRTLYAEISNTGENFPFVEHGRNPSNRHAVSQYIFTGFAGLQVAIDLAFVRRVAEKLGTTNAVPTLGFKEQKIGDLYQFYKASIHVRQFEYPYFLEADVKFRNWSAIVLFFTIGNILSNFCVAQGLCFEAKQGNMELLKLHGLTPAIHWTSVTINTALLRFFTSFFLALTVHLNFTVDEGLPYPHLVILWLFLFLHGLAHSCEIFFITHFFSSPTAGGMGVIFYSVASFLIPMGLFSTGVLSGTGNFFLTFLLPQWCLANGIYSYLQYELYEEQLEYYDFPILLDSEHYIIVSIQMCCIIFFFSTALYLLLTIYIDQVISKPLSPGMNWLYCLRKYREPKPENQKPTPPINLAEMPKVFEKAPTDLVCTARVRNLCKTFATSKSYEISLDDINLDIYEGEITAVVGQAGSGKTNLLHLIGGLLEPTSGFVEIKNLKMKHHSDLLGNFVSICPQKSMLFSTLSVEDHVRLCCMVHGMSYKKAKSQAKLLMQLFNLTGWKRHNSDGLSHTAKKHLAMAMALASQPKMLLLDNPFEGMDSEATKLLWRYLQALKKNRTIIVATTQLSDAEVFSDRMALLAKGKLVCYASPSRIKRYYDIGLVLCIHEDGDEADIEGIERILKLEVKTFTTLRPMGYEPFQMMHRFLLPYGQAYAALLENLEDNMNKLTFSKISLARAEIRTVFSKISQGKDVESVVAAREAIYAKTSGGSIGMKSVIHHEIPSSVTSPTSTFTQFSTLYAKKRQYMLQKNSLLVNEFIIPMMMMVVAVAFAAVFLDYKPESLSRPIHINMYQNTTTLIKAPTDAWFNAFSNALGDVPIIRLGAADIRNVISKSKEHTITNFRKQSIIGMEQTTGMVIAHYSENSYHSCPISLNVLVNAFLYLLSENKTNPFVIHVSNNPIEQYEGYSAGTSQVNSSTVFGVFISIILALVAAAELRLPLWEKRHELKHTILMTGVHPYVYWLTNACGDLIMNSIVTLVLIGIVCICDMWKHQIRGVEEKVILTTIVFGYLCWSSIPYSYMLSFMFKTQNNGYGQFLILHFCLGIFPKIITFQFFRTEIEGFQKWSRYILHVLPPYSIVSALVNYFHTVAEGNFCTLSVKEWKDDCNTFEKFKNGTQVDIPNRKDWDNTLNYDELFRSCCQTFCEEEGSCHKPEPFFVDAPIPGLAGDMVAMAAQGIFYWVLVIITEHDIPQSFFFFFYSNIFGDKEKKSSVEDTRDADEPEDVKKEHVKVDYLIDVDDTAESQVFLMQDVTKFYHAHKCIDHAYFSIPTNCTTAILGLSKSGRTTLLKLLIAEFFPTSGNIYMDDEVMSKKNRIKCVTKIGYCPQNSIMYPDLTGFQMLQLMGKLRGIPELQVDVHASRWLDVFGLTTDAHLQCKYYRPGVLRRICCAMAMIGNPKVAIFDHPTDGMDLQERNLFWIAITMAKDNGQTIIFSSSETTEVQMSANKVLLLDQGAIMAVGTLQDIFRSSARGFILSVRCRASAFKKLNVYQIGAKIDQLRDHILSHLSPCELLLDEGDLLIYHLKDVTVKLSYCFGIMEGAREKFPNLVDNFLVSEPSLDEVIINFHKKTQVPPSHRASGSIASATSDG